MAALLRDFNVPRTCPRTMLLVLMTIKNEMNDSPSRDQAHVMTRWSKWRRQNYIDLYVTSWVQPVTLAFHIMCCLRSVS